jgi:multidrug resistance protein, MATE family
MSASERLQLDETTNHKTDLRLLIALSVPMVINNTSRTVMSFVDFAMVSRLGTDAQAALAPATIVLFCLISFGFGVMGCVNTFASQALGRDEPSECSAYLWQGVFWSILFGCAALVFLPLVPQVYGLFGHAPEVQRLEIIYTRIGLFSLAPSIATAAFSNFFNGIHRPGVTMASSIAANLFNVVGDYALIYGKFGFSAMGVAGAAWATVLSTIFQTLFLLGAALMPRFARTFHTVHTMRWDTRRAFNLLRLGLPAGGQAVLELIAWVLFLNVLIGRFGTRELAATNIAWKYMELSWMPAFGIGMAISAIVGKAIGQGDLDAARRRTRLGRNVVIGYMGLMSLVFLVFRHPLIGLLNHDAAIIDLGAKVLICAALFQVFDGLTITYLSALRGAGDILVPAVLFTVLGWGIVIFGGYAVAIGLPGLGSLGPWIAATVYITLMGLIMALRWRAGRWTKIDIFRYPEQQGSPAVTAPTPAPPIAAE